MSDQKSDAKKVPGAGAGDAAHSTRIPQIDRPESAGPSTDGGGTNGATPKPSASKGDGWTGTAPAKNGVTTTTNVPKTDAPKSDAPKTDAPQAEVTEPAPAKAAPTSAAAAKSAPTPATNDKPASSTTDKGRTRSVAPKPLSASDYARTTRSSPDTTSVIPSVKPSADPTDKPSEAAVDTTTESKRPSTKPAVMWDEPKKAAPTTTVDTTEPTTSGESGGGIGGRSAVLRMAYIEPWSVTRMAFAVSVALMIVSVVATAIFWLVLEVTGVWDQIDGSVTSVLSDDAAGFNITDYLGFGRLVGLALVLSALNVVVLTLLATIAAHLYNLAAQLLGGFQVRFVSKS